MRGRRGEGEGVRGGQAGREGRGEFPCRAEGGGPSGASGVRAVSQATAEFQRMLQGVDAVAAVAADVQRPTAAVTAGQLDIEPQLLEHCALGPAETHWTPPVCLLGPALSNPTSC